MNEGRSKFPGTNHTVGFKPIRDGLRLVTACNVLEFGSLPFRSFLRGVKQILPMFGSETFAELAEKGLNFVGGFLHVDRGPTSRRSRIVQFVRQSRSHGA